MDRTAQDGDMIAGVGLLADTARRGLYDFVVAQAAPVTREEAAQAIGLSRTLAAYHLDRMADAGLLDVSYARTAGRTGPGSCRPAKRYARAVQEVAVSLPPRNYSLLAHILADAVSGDDSGEVAEAVTLAARHVGQSLGSSATPFDAVLDSSGFEPERTDDGEVTLRNCPFHSVVSEHTALVCTLNHAFVQGVLTGTGERPERAELCPGDGRCCVIIRAEGRAQPA